MQIQGSGKIRLPDGQLLRIAYREQNGHPFTPTVATPSGRPKAARTRGLAAEIVLEDEATGPAAPVLVRGLHLAPAASPPPAPPPVVASAPAGAGGAEVEAWVDKLLAQHAPASGKKAAPPVSAPMAPAPSSSKPPPAALAFDPPTIPAPRPPPPLKVATMAPAPSSAGPAATIAWPAAISQDPSYVFFREIPDSPEGPIGALGVPLTAGRSIAVDPRTTPLGLPVFLATRDPQGRGTLNRLMIAQDTGGAISGAVRADYFWGFGNDARTLASRMKENGQMWLLMPKGYPVANLTAARRTRSLGAAGEPECVVPDPDLCVEDRPTAP
ncbi:MAG: MltA domain-containing protein [Zoogloeaceae bacterium]|nr:MltA domain-containing protein [Zoogloeaceae bacterium]